MERVFEGEVTQDTSKRSKFELVGDILEAIQRDASKSGSARMTRVQAMVNMPYDRMKDYVENLAEIGLIELIHHSPYSELRLTEKAHQFLSEYERVKSFQSTLGLDKSGKEEK